MIRRLLFLLLLCALPAHADEFSLTDLQGKTLKLSGFHGKWVLLNFWSPYCKPCQSEIPELVSLYREHGNRDLVVIGIAMNPGNAKAVQEYVQAMKIPYPVIPGSDRVSSQFGDIGELPTSYLYNPSGDLTAQHEGPVSRDIIDRLIR
ncbi:MAG: TlpA family protein disulfide reductase [Burkholderiales bacterium]|nr:TlpA family protein disulfide reductase [Burkholderiales bacterium]